MNKENEKNINDNNVNEINNNIFNNIENNMLLAIFILILFIVISTLMILILPKERENVSFGEIIDDYKYDEDDKYFQELIDDLDKEKDENTNLNDKIDLDLDVDFNNEIKVDDLSEEYNEIKNMDYYTEAEVSKLLKERGFNGNIRYSYDINGNFVDDIIVSKDSNEKHPTYDVSYTSPNRRTFWNIMVVGKQIIATPLEYVYQSGEARFYYILENDDNMINYESKTNKFYKSPINEYIEATYKVNKIDAKTLDELTENVFEFKSTCDDGYSCGE